MIEKGSLYCGHICTYVATYVIVIWYYYVIANYLLTAPYPSIPLSCAVEQSIFLLL